jgi:hypothetical protein
MRVKGDVKVMKHTKGGGASYKSLETSDLGVDKRIILN